MQLTYILSAESPSERGLVSSRKVGMWLRGLGVAFNPYCYARGRFITTGGLWGKFSLLT